MLGIEPTPERRRETVTVIALASLYLVLWTVLPKPSFWGLDNGFKFQGSKAFAETGSIHVPYTGIDFDPKGEYRPMVFPFGVIRDGEQIPVFSPVFMILTGIMIKIFGSIGAFILPLLGGWATLLAAWYMWIRYRAKRDGRIFLIVLGLGSPLLFYSMTLWEHSWAMALATLSVALLGRGIEWRKSPVHIESFLSGLLLAVATALRTEALLWALIMLLLWRYTDRNWRSFWRYFAGLLIGIPIIVLINFLTTGEPFPLHLTTNLFTSQTTSFQSVLITRAKNIFVALMEGFRSPHWSVIGLIPLLIIGLWSDWRREKNHWKWIAPGAFAAWSGYIYVAFTSANRAGYTSRCGGLFWVIPFIVLSILYLRGERRKFWRMIWMGAYLYLIFALIFSPYTRGVHWGPRFVLLVIPFLLMIASTRAQRWWQRYKPARPIVVLLLLMSIVNQLYSYVVLYEQKSTTAAMNEWVCDLGPDPVLTPIFWLSGDASLCSYGTPWFLTTRIDRVQTVIEVLKSKGIERFNFIQNADYIKDTDWRKLGVELVGQDRFVDGFGRKTAIVNKRVRINPSPRSP